jgi:hypothetical protein
MKRKKIALLFVALMIGATTIFAQGWRNTNRPGNVNGPRFEAYGPGNCMMLLPDLTDEQKEKMTAMAVDHQKGMVELRVKQRSTADPIEKHEIRGEMLKKVMAHRSGVRDLLTEEQQKQLDLLQSRNVNRPGGLKPGCRAPRGRAGFGRQGGGFGYRGGW